MSDTYATLLLRRDGALLFVTLNRPESLNAMNAQLVSDLHALFAQLRADRSVRVIVLRGAGRAFCAGLDLKSGARESSDPGGVAGGLAGQRRISELVIEMRRLPQPIIACVHGAASGGGFALALASDVRIAGESARMNAAFIRIGLTACDVGVSYFLPRIVGSSVASELLLTGNFIEAKRALSVGLVSRVVPDADLEKAATELAQDMVRNSPLGLALTKDCLNFALDAPSLEAAVAMEDRNQILASQSGDIAEGMRAFLEKRPPRWRDA
jgi:enoyl-CoA hydratase